MFAHLMLLAAFLSCLAMMVYESFPYRSLVIDKVDFAYDYVIGNVCILHTLVL